MTKRQRVVSSRHYRVRSCRFGSQAERFFCRVARYVFVHWCPANGLVSACKYLGV